MPRMPEWQALQIDTDGWSYGVDTLFVQVEYEISIRGGGFGSKEVAKGVAPRITSTVPVRTECWCLI